MPGVFHELLVFLIRSLPGCAQALLGLACPPVSQDDWLAAPLRYLAVVDSNLSVDSDRELRADLVFVAAAELEASGSRRRGLVFEIQLEAPKATKERAWLAYCAEFWLREHVEPALVVVTDDDGVVRRANHPIAPAGPTLWIRPLVVHCRDIVSIFIDGNGKPTAVLTAERLRADESLRGLFLIAVAYSARSNPEAIRQLRPLLRDVLNRVDAQTAVRYTDAVSQLSPTASQLVESIMRPYKEEPYEFKSEYFRPAYLKGIAEGKAEGKAEGEAEGILVGQRGALKLFLTHRNQLTADAERLIDSAESRQLEQWLDQVAQGLTPSELLED